jgi:hypothetical protein
MTVLTMQPGTQARHLCLHAFMGGGVVEIYATELSYFVPNKNSGHTTSTLTL